MKSKISETIKAFFGTLVFLILGLFVFLIWIPHDIITSPNHTLLFDIGVVRYVGLVPIVIGTVIYFWCSSSVKNIWRILRSIANRCIAGFLV